MAPEQIEAEPVDGRADLYALGCLLHEMLGGSPPFTHASPYMIPDLHRVAEPTPLRALAPSVPEPVECLVLDLLAKNPADRPPHAGDVYVRLAPYLPAPAPPEQALVPWAGADPPRPFTHPMSPCGK